MHQDNKVRNPHDTGEDKIMKKDKNKLCPLKFATPQSRVIDEVGWVCTEACALWIPGESRCSFRLLAEALNQISNHSKFQ